MPYIHESQRNKFSNITCQIVMNVISVPGELNYLFTMLIKRYLDCQGESYATYNDIIGALEACKMELYRRKTAEYENKKISGNGDVW